MISFTAAACGGGSSNPPDGAPDAPGVPDGAPDAPPGRQITVNVASEPGAPIAVVFQDGTGAWQRATDAGGGDFTFAVSAGRYGVGVTCVDGDFQDASFSFATVDDDAPSLFAGCGFGGTPITVHAVNGTVSGLVGRGYRARLGNRSLSDSTTAATANFSTAVAEGTRDFLFGRYPGGGPREHIDRLAVFRDIAVVADMTFDVDLVADAAPTESRPIELVGITGAETPFAFAQYYTAAASLNLTNDASDPITADLPADTQWITGDSLYLFTSADTYPAYRQVARTYAARADVPATIGLALPDPMVGAEVEVLPAGGRFQFRAASDAPVAGAASYNLYIVSSGVTDASCTGELCLPQWYLTATPAYVGTSFVLVTPDPAELEAAGAWDDRLSTPSGTEVYYDTYADRYDGEATYYSGASDYVTI